MPVRWQLLRGSVLPPRAILYEAGVQLGRLLRTAFLADYFVKDAFRNELRRADPAGINGALEGVNSLAPIEHPAQLVPESQACDWWSRMPTRA